MMHLRLGIVQTIVKQHDDRIASEADAIERDRVLSAHERAVRDKLLLEQQQRQLAIEVKIKEKEAEFQKQVHSSSSFGEGEIFAFPVNFEFVRSLRYRTWKRRKMFCGHRGPHSCPPDLPPWPLLVRDSLLLSPIDNTRVMCIVVVLADPAEAAKKQKEAEEKRKAEQIRNEERKKLAQSFYSSIITTTKIARLLSSLLNSSFSPSVYHYDTFSNRIIILPSFKISYRVRLRKIRRACRR